MRIARVQDAGWMLAGVAWLAATASAHADEASGADATLTAVESRVEVWHSGRPEWAEGKAGDTFLGRDQLHTPAGASATLRMRDQATLRLGENTAIALVDSGESTRTWHRSSAVELTQGELRVGPGGTLGTQVTTPAAQVAAAGATMSVSVDAQKATHVSVFDGSVVVTAQGRSITVQAGSGVRVGARFEDAQPLPDAPPWSAGGSFDTVFSVKRATTVTLRWGETTSAVVYLVELSRDESFETDLIDHAVDARTARVFDAPQIEIGRYFARVSAINGAGLVSAPSATKMIDVRQLVIEAGGAGPKPNTITGAVEIRVRIPESAHITVDGVAVPRSPAVIRGVGVHELRIKMGDAVPQTYECTVELPRAKVGFTRDLKHMVIQFFDRQGRPVAFMRRPDVNIGLRGDLGTRPLEPEPVGDGHEWRAEVTPYRAMSSQIGVAVEVLWNGQSIGGAHAEATVEQ